MYKVVYKQDSFTDYKGVQVNFILAACSIKDSHIITSLDDNGRMLKSSYSPKILSLGLSVCNPNDTFDVERGKKIALNKALGRRDHVLAVTDPGIINTEVVNAVLEQEVKYIKINPGKYIAGYEDAKTKYLTSKQLEDSYTTFTPEEKKAIDFLITNGNDPKFLEAVEYRRKELANNSSDVSSVPSEMP